MESFAMIDAPFTLIQYRTSHTKADGTIAFHSYYLETLPDDNLPIAKIVEHALSSPEGEQWRLVTWTGKYDQDVVPLTSWQLTKFGRTTGSPSSFTSLLSHLKEIPHEHR